MRQIEAAYPPRPYQEKALTAGLEGLEIHQRILIVCATGLGKTYVFAMFAKLGIVHGRKILILVDRDELVSQAKKRLRDDVFLEAAIEKGARKAPRDSALVIASVQSLHEERLATWAKDHFDLIIVDEAHHATAPTYKRIFAHFDQAKVIGVTATPDRADAVKLTTIFDDVVFDMGMREAVEQGWLVPPMQRFEHVDGLDFTAVRRVANELDANDLDSILRNEEILKQMCIPMIKRVENRQTIVFCVSVAHAHAVAEFLRANGKTAEAVDESTGKKARRQIVEDFRLGNIQYLVNVEIFKEGFDAPIASAIVMMRFTLSRALYAQMVGRGARPYPTDFINSLDTPSLRRAAIAASSKPDFLILDFVGNSGKHKLVYSVDALSPGIDPEIAQRAQRIMDEKPELALFDAMAMAELAVTRLRERMREEVVGTIWSNSVSVDPFRETPAGQTMELFGMDRMPDYWNRMATPAQVDALVKFGVKNAAELNRREASALLTRLGQQIRHKRATARQMQALIKNGVPREQALQMSFEDASQALDAQPVTTAQIGVLIRHGFSHEEITAMGRGNASKTISAIQENGWKRPLQDKTPAPPSAET